jgi:hypothetical protein
MKRIGCGHLENTVVNILAAEGSLRRHDGRLKQIGCANACSAAIAFLAAYRAALARLQVLESETRPRSFC